MSDVKGVAFNPPPPSLMDSVKAHAVSEASKLGPGKSGALIGHVTNTGMNVTIVHRIKNDWVVEGYIGKDWGSELKAGATVINSW